MSQILPSGSKRLLLPFKLKSEASLPTLWKPASGASSPADSNAPPAIQVKDLNVEGIAGLSSARIDW
ncbi:MAG: hypothetical protein ACREP8_03695, partial [Candidatus Binatia bacterium]